jgi:hypothetical protein
MGALTPPTSLMDPTFDKNKTSIAYELQSDWRRIPNISATLLTTGKGLHPLESHLCSLSKPQDVSVTSETKPIGKDISESAVLHQSNERRSSMSGKFLLNREKYFHQ